MERLTIPDVRVDEHTTRGTIIDARVVREHAMDFYWRLKAYEDTGLMPDEIKSMQGEHFSGLEMAKLHSALMELKKYQEANKDGRLVVLPCKVGDTVYILRRTFDGADVVGEAELWWDDIPQLGKTVFLTREAAEKALEAMKDE